MNRRSPSVSGVSNVRHVFKANDGRGELDGFLKMPLNDGGKPVIVSDEDEPTRRNHGRRSSVGRVIRVPS